MINRWQLLFALLVLMIGVILAVNNASSGNGVNLKCIEGPTLRNGYVANGSSEIGANRTIKCLKGYYLSQTRRETQPLAFCEKNAKWLIKARCLKVTPDALMTAMIDGEVAKLEHMLEQNPMSLDAVTFNSGLVRASENGHLNIVRFLVTRLPDVIDVNTRSEDRGYTALISAAKSNNTELVQFLLANGADAEATSYKGSTSALTYAVISGNLDAVRLLLERAPLMVASADMEGTMPLHFAASKNRSSEISQLLIEKEADVNAMTSYGFTPLLYASRYGNFETVRLLLQHGANVKASDVDMTTSLHFAALNCRDDITSLLIDHEADLNAKNSNGHTALMMAVMNGCPTERLVRLLIEQGSDLFAVDNKGYNLLMLAASRSNNKETIQLLVNKNRDLYIDVEAKSKTNVNALLTAAYYGQTETVGMLLDQGADIESRDNSGSTPLILASKKSHLNTVDLLLKRGANINAKMKQNWTALMFASEYGWLPIVRLLVSQRGVDVNAFISSGRDNALTLAARNGQESVVDLLLDQQAIKVNALNRFGDTALIMLANDVNKSGASNLAKTFELLIRKGRADVNAREVYGSTALIFAVKHNLTLDVVRVLVGNGADVNASNAFGASPLSLAVGNNREDVVRFLLDHDADVNAKTAGYYGQHSLLIEATLSQQVNIVRLLIERGADLSETNDDGMTALEIAMLPKRGRRSSLNEVEILRLLSKAEALQMSSLIMVNSSSTSNFNHLLPSGANDDY